MSRSIPAAVLGAASLFHVASAEAADLPRCDAPMPLPVPSAFTWTGLYAGVNAGYGIPTGRGGFTDPTYGGVTGGGQIGYTYQSTPGSGFVIGFEADIQGAAFAEADAAYLGTKPNYGVRPSLDYFGTVRGRVGYAFDRVLIYGTGGFAYGGGERPTRAAADPYTQPATSRTGYAVGGGIEYAFTKSLSARIEALYVDLGRGFNGATYDNTATSAYYGAGQPGTGFALVRSGLNYRF